MPTRSRPSSMRIGLLCPSIGNGNLGDEATVAAVIQNLRRRCPTASLYVLSAHPDDTRRRHGIPTFPIARQSRRPSPPIAAGVAPHTTSQAETTKVLSTAFRTKLQTLPPLYALLRALRMTATSGADCLRELLFLNAAHKLLASTDLLIVPGSGILSDHFGGPFNFPFTLFKWSLLTQAARTRLAFLSVGAGPLRSPLSRWFVKRSLSLADYRSCRDVTSRRVLEELGRPGSMPICPDLAAGLSIDSLPRRSARRRPIVAINVFPHCDARYWPMGDTAKYQRYIHTIASFALWLIERKYQVFFFPTQIRADTLVIRDIKEIITRHAPSDLKNLTCEVPVDSLSDLLQFLSTADIVIATRFHGILLSFLLNKPVVAIANHHKMSDIMHNMCQADHLLDIETFDKEILIEKFLSLISKSNIIKDKIAERINDYRHRLDSQYNEVLG